MFAIDGPIASISAPFGTFVLIQLPSSRPPGTPPEPARNVSDSPGLIRCQVGIATDAATQTAAALISSREGRGTLPMRRLLEGCQRASVRPASTATAGAHGSKYWKPLTG